MMTDANKEVWEIIWTSVSEDGLLGWVSTLEEAQGIRRAFEFETGTKYVGDRKTGIWNDSNGKDTDADFDFLEKKSKRLKKEAEDKHQAQGDNDQHLDQIEGQCEGQHEGQQQGQTEGQHEGHQNSKTEGQQECQTNQDVKPSEKLNLMHNDKVLRYKVRFKDDIGNTTLPVDGVPFISVSRFTHSCVYGKDKHAALKKRNKTELETDKTKFGEEAISIIKRRCCKKVSCPAKIVMKKVVRFPDFKVDKMKARKIRETSERIRHKLLMSEDIKKEIRVYVKLPKDTEHENHELVEKPKKRRKSLYTYNPNASMATIKDIEKAYKVVQESELCVRTPMMHHAQDWLRLDVSCDLSLKLENTQTTGSFKVRGLANQLANIPKSITKSKQEVITMSAGNYGKAFSFAMQQLGLKARVLMPDTAPQVREDILRGYGAEVERLPSSKLQPTVDRYVSNDGMHFLHPFDDIHLICGHASTGLEILEEVPDPDVIVVCCGGGGLLAGIAAAVKLSGKSHTRIYGVEPEQACCMHTSKQFGEPVEDPSVHSIASGLAPPFAGSNAYRHVAKYVDDILLLSEEEIIASVSRLYHSGLVVEPAGAAAFGALLFGKVPDIEGKKVVVVITGGNVSPEELCNIVKTAS